jgi:transcriptional regulator with XRE-family HTH domain
LYQRIVVPAIAPPIGFPMAFAGQPNSGSNKSHRRAHAAASADINVGGRLRELRRERGFSLRALAGESGLNANTLSLIENGRTSPGVATLQELSMALNVPITAFFESAAPRQEITFQKAGQRPRVSFEHGDIEDLGTGLLRFGAEPMAVTLRPHAEGDRIPIVHTGREFVYCLAGCVTYTIGDQTYVLEEGDSLMFEAYLPHHWRNAGGVAARFLLVLCPMDESDPPTGRHFSRPE